ncbi:hypothetical protein GCM10007964_35270 [Sphaerisporangium melleum]|uniref:Uncharacterized protein n=1 Tax=Sphaerisporangium melleum TaxID=321316 RepID=A0A917R4T5_9ACTN|nr:hypothetical protein GCM10007964_35270 [Sphaerisporangium melleum]
MACGAAGQGTIRLHERAIPFSIEAITAALIASVIPKSSQLTMSTRASGGNPSNSLDLIGAPPFSDALSVMSSKPSVPRQKFVI